MQAEPLGPEQGARARAVACLRPLGLHMLRRHHWVPPAQEPPAAVPQGQCPDTQCTPKQSAGLALGQSPAVTSKISKKQDFFPGGLSVKTLCFQRRGHHCNPGQVTKIPQAAWGTQKKEK